MFSHLENIFTKTKPSKNTANSRSERPALQPRASSHPSSVFNLPPQKVVRAERDYVSKLAQELTFKKGDFFYVIGGDNNMYWEVIQPTTRQRGIVPCDCFESLDRAKAMSAPPESRDRTGMEPKESGALGRKSEFYPKGNPKEAVIEFISVPAVECQENGVYQFTIECKLSDLKKRILHRTYDEFWALQVSLLNHFPSESGRKNRPRIIPFMQPPTRDWTSTYAQQKRHQLDIYLQDLIKLPEKITGSLSIKRFMHLRGSDIETYMNIGFDSSELILDLIADYLVSHEIKLTIVFGERVDQWKISDTSTYANLLDEIEERMKIYAPRLCYEDECQQLLTLYGDNDLRLLLSANSKLVLFVVD